MPARWSLRLFGGFELAVLPGGARVTSLGKRERVLLAYLSLSPKGSQPRRKLATLLWGDANDDTLLDNLRACIWKLRKALGDFEHRVVASAGEDIVLDIAAFEVDALAFRRLAGQSGRTELEAAASLSSGEFLEGLDIDSDEFETWRRAEAARSRDQAVDVLNRLMTQWCELGETERAIDVGTRILRLEPAHEAAVRHLMRLYGDSGRRGAAIQLYRTLMETLKTELNAEPEGETRAVLAEILRGGDGQLEASAVTATRTDAKSPSPPSMVARLRQSAPPELVLDPPHSLASAVFAFPQAKRIPLKWILAGGLAATMALLIISQFAPSAGITTAQKPTGLEAANAASFSQPDGISIAVLPFENLSDDAGQQFFSDGMTAEITAALAKVRDLQVVARASAFQFKGEKKDMRAVGQFLGARYLIDGSMRSTGTRVRITVQLIRSDQGVSVWSESYDRELTDVFAIQEDIAKAIAMSLRVPLGLSPGQTLITSRIADPEIYEQYLRGRAQLRSRNFPAAFNTLEAVVARAPGFAPGWAALAGAYRAGSAAAVRNRDLEAISLSIIDNEEAAARKAIQLDASYVGGYAELAAVQHRRGKWAEALDLYTQALSLDSYDSDLLNVYSQTLAAVGRLNEALRVRERMRELEPLEAINNEVTARIMLANGQIDATIKILEPNLSTAVPRNAYLAEAYAMKGRFADAADTLLRISTQMDRRPVEDAARLLRSAPRKTDAPDKLPSLQEDLAFIYAHIGALERLLEIPEKSIKEGRSSGAVTIVWRPAAAPLRKTERFKALVRTAGLVDYWRARGWPDLCRPLSADDFVCD